jgi:hypothetical protein
MQLIRLQSLYTLYFLLVSISSAQAHDRRRHHRARDIFSPIESLADSILGITSTQSTEQTAVVASTTSQTATTQNDSTTNATPQVVTVVPTAASTGSSSQSRASGTESNAIRGSTSTLTASSTTSSSVSTTADQSSSQTRSESSTLASSAPPNPANPIQGLSSSSAASPQLKQDNGNSVPAAGVAVAVVFGALILAGVAYLLYRYFRNVRQKPATSNPSTYNDPKRYSYSDHDVEQGMAHNVGLGLGKVATLRTVQGDSATYNAQQFRACSRAGSDDMLLSESTLPIPPPDRRESPLPPLPNEAQESWSIISPMDAPHPQSLLVTLPATNTPSGKVATAYIPYRREVEPVIGLAVPLSSSYTQSGKRSNHPPPISEQTHEVAAFDKARRVSGVHELS